MSPPTNPQCPLLKHAYMGMAAIKTSSVLVLQHACLCTHVLIFTPIIESDGVKAPAHEQVERSSWPFCLHASQPFSHSNRPVGDETYSPRPVMYLKRRKACVGRNMSRLRGKGQILFVCGGCNSDRRLYSPLARQSAQNLFSSWASREVRTVW